jgi:hypothetical protein
MASPTRLNQIIAVRKGVNGDTHRTVTELHRQVQKAPLLSGITRTYEKLADEAPDLPSEATKVQVSAEGACRELATALTRLFDVNAALDWTNQSARADLVVDGVVLIADVPVTYLMFLEKQLVDIETFVRKLPQLDPAETWHVDPATGVWATEPAKTTKTAKVPRNHVLAPATDKHPAQVQVWQEDVVVGYWRTVKFSGAMEAARVNELLHRVTTLVEAVKIARERANMTDIVDPKPGSPILGYLFR